VPPDAELWTWAIQNGAVGVALVAVLLWLRALLAHGLTLTFKLDGEQLKQITSSAVRVAELEAAHDRLVVDLGRIGTRVTELAVRVDERTKRRTSSDRNPAIPG
jgi:hypothetical protein